jgi:hypothetical protein
MRNTSFTLIVVWLSSPHSDRFRPTMHPWILLLAAGVVCGFLNAAASSGSALTLPLLLMLGLPPAVANGTNRLPVLVGMASALWNFQRSRVIPWSFALRLLPVFLLSALAGAGLATILPMDQIRGLVHVALVLAFFLVLLKPQRWLSANAVSMGDQPPSIVLQCLMAVVGLWAGLIVLDVATYLLVSLVLVGGLGVQQASAVKVVLIGASTMISLAVFIHGGDVDWPSALPLMVGSAFGGWLGAALALGPQARLWIYRLLLLALSFELALMIWGFLHPSTKMIMM